MNTHRLSSKGMPPTIDKSRQIQGRFLFDGSRRSIVASARTPIDRQPIAQPRITKPHKPRFRDTADTISNHKNTKKHALSESTLADKFSESLDSYRDSLCNEVSAKLCDTEKNLNLDLEQLSLDIEGNIHKLGELEDPTQKPFTEEALTLDKGSTAGGTQVVLLKDSISEFRDLYNNKMQLLDKLWKEWEAVQFCLIHLAVEMYGKTSIEAIQLSKDEVTIGQRDKFETTLKANTDTCRDSAQEHAAFQMELEAFKEELDQIVDKAEQDADDIQQSYEKKKMKGLEQVNFILTDIKD